MQDTTKELAQEHWEYIFELLNVSMLCDNYERQEVINMCCFHYLTAWEHGAKHYAELMERK